MGGGGGGQTGTQPDPRATVVLVSLDGFRYDYLDLYPSPNLHRLMARGVRAPLVPVFLTKTFPNHYSVVTGLYPVHHGVVDNTMYDPEFDATFRINDTLAVRDSRWWGGEPLWVTAQKQGRVAAAFFWPGSEAEIAGVRPRYWVRYNSRVPNPTRVQQVLDWLTLAESTPTFVTLYMSDIDGVGHDSGPANPAVAAAILRVDSAMGLLLDGIDRRGLADRVNVIVVSDHGMSKTSPDSVMALDDYIQLDLLAHTSGGNPVFGLWPKPGMEDSVYAALRGKHPHVQVWRTHEIPIRFHYRAHRRIPPILALADAGWSITTRRRDVTEHPERFSGGTHGYDDTLAVMRAIFLAQGPAFRSGIVAPAFRNIHIYDLISSVLGLAPAPNDGSPDSTAALLRPR
jgi:predicted AlkP superfamily pyrophosphatase or phosphodiesterase